jgi:hypothetical protein
VWPWPHEPDDNTMVDRQMETPEESNQTDPVVSSPITSSTSASRYRPSVVKANRAVVQDLKSVEIVPLSSIFECILPVVRTDEVDSIVATLKQTETLGKYGWECFKVPKFNEAQSLDQSANVYGPEHSRGTKDTIFRQFEGIYNAVMAAGAKLDDSFEPILTLLAHGDENPATDWPSSTRPDATLHLTESNVPFISRAGERYRVDHADVVTYFQWKKKDTEYNYWEVSTHLPHPFLHRSTFDSTP